MRKSKTRRTTALRRTTASWRSTASRCATLDPAHGATTLAAFCVLVVQRARARARGDHTRRNHALDALACSACSMYDRIVTQDGLTRLAALGDLATCGDLAQRTGVSWRATVSRPIALDAPALEVDHVIYADLRTCASQSRDARRLRDARRPGGARRPRGARRSTLRSTQPHRLRSMPSSLNVHALALEVTTLDATSHSTRSLTWCA